MRLAGTLASIRERHPAPPSAIARASSSSYAPSWSSTPASTMRPTGCSAGPPERQWKANEPRVAPTTKAPSAPSGAMAVIEVTTLARSLVARATVAPARRKSVTVWSPSPTSRTTVTVSETTGTVVTSPVRPGGAGRLEEAEEVDAEQLGRLVGAGTEDDVAVLAREDREGPDLGATDLVRQRRAEGELRG